MDLQIPIKGLKDRVFKMYARRLEKLGIQMRPVQEAMLDTMQKRFITK